MAPPEKYDAYLNTEFDSVSRAVVRVRYPLVRSPMLRIVLLLW